MSPRVPRPRGDDPPKIPPRSTARSCSCCFRRACAAPKPPALEWRDVVSAATPGAFRIVVRASKTNQDGAPDIRFVKNGAARALAAIRPFDAITFSLGDLWS